MQVVVGDRIDGFTFSYVQLHSFMFSYVQLTTQLEIVKLTKLMEGTYVPYGR